LSKVVISERFFRGMVRNRCKPVFAGALVLVDFIRFKRSFFHESGRFRRKSSDRHSITGCYAVIKKTTGCRACKTSQNPELYFAPDLEGFSTETVNPSRGAGGLTPFHDSDCVACATRPQRGRPKAR